MKNLKTYILETNELSVYRLDEVTVTYDCNPKKLTIQAPESYQESDIQQYLNDLILNNLPSGQDYSERFFGRNCDNIYDAYFEYDKFEHLDKESSKREHHININWDPEYATKTSTDDDIDIFRLTNLKYVIKFDRFNLVDVDDNNVYDTLCKIFDVTVSNNANQYPIEISLNNKNIKYKK